MLSISDDFARVLDGLAPARLVRRGAPPGDPGAELSHTLSRELGRADAAATEGHLAACDTLWSLTAAEVNEPPAPGDVIVDSAGTRHTILEVRGLRLASVWQCRTRNLVLAHGLDTAVAVLAANFEPGSHGSLIATWTEWLADVPARVQPVAVVGKADADSRETIARFDVYLIDVPPLSPCHRIRTADGTLYQVLGFRPATRLAEAHVAETEICE